MLYPMALYRVGLFVLALYARVRWNITAEDVALLLRASKLAPGPCTCSAQRCKASRVDARRTGARGSTRDAASRSVLAR